MTSSTNVIQVTNVSPSSTAEQMRTLFGFIGTIDELRLFPPDDSPLPVTSRVCFVKFHEPESVGVSQHLTNTVFVDRALIVVPFAEGVIPDESKALSLLAPANAVAGLLPGGGLLPTPNPVPSMGGVHLGGLGGPNLDPMAALAMAAPNINTQSLSAEQLMKLMASIDPKLNHLAAGLSLTPGLKADGSKEIEEAMKRVREAQSLISAAIEPGSDNNVELHYRGLDPIRAHVDPANVSSSSKRHRRSRSASRSPKKSRSPKRKVSRSPSPRRHKKEKKKDKDRERDRERDRKDDWDRNRDKRERSSSKKSKDKDKDRDRDRKSDSEKGDVKVTRDYDEEEQGYDSEHEEERERNSDAASSPQAKELRADSADDAGRGESDGHSEDQRDEDMDMSD
uniref:Serine and arginine rich splicing factor 11 n=1 Tax=Cyprinus carpio carpio TaxID=630221 RepID=A0A9J8DKE2_CYPCA